MIMLYLWSLFCLLETELLELSYIQGTTAWIQTSKKGQPEWSQGPKKHDHITPILKTLHRLLVEQHINFKIILFTFKTLNDAAPSYIKELLTIHEGQR